MLHDPDLRRFSRRRLPFRELAGTQPSANRLALHIQRFGNRPLRVSERVQLYDLLVPIEPALPAFIAANLLLGPFRARIRLPATFDVIARWVCDPQLCPAAFQSQFNSRSTIHEQMKAISDLNGIWCARRRALGIDAATVAGDYLDRAALLKPDFQFICGPAQQQIYDTMPFQVDEDRPGLLPFPTGPIVNAETSDRLGFHRRYLGTEFHCPDHCVITHCDRQPTENSTARQASWQIYAVDSSRFTQIAELFRAETAVEGVRAQIEVIAFSTAQVRERLRIAYDIGFRDFQISLLRGGR